MQVLRLSTEACGPAATLQGSSSSVSCYFWFFKHTKWKPHGTWAECPWVGCVPLHAESGPGIHTVDDEAVKRLHGSVSMVIT